MCNWYTRSDLKKKKMVSPSTSRTSSLHHLHRSVSLCLNSLLHVHSCSLLVFKGKTVWFYIIPTTERLRIHPTAQIYQLCKSTFSPHFRKWKHSDRKIVAHTQVHVSECVGGVNSAIKNSILFNERVCPNSVWRLSSPFNDKIAEAFTRKTIDCDPSTNSCTHLFFHVNTWSKRLHQP